MNERIDEIAYQAGCNRTKYYDPRPPTVEGWVITQDELDKFAELIIRECVRIPYDMWDKAELNADIAAKIDHRIKEHFGIEE